MSSRPSRGAARLAAILDALPDALLLVNCNGTVVNANAIALEVFETPGTALVGRGLLDLLPEFDSKRIPGSMRRPDEDEGEARTKPTRMIARRTDGSAFPVEVTSANLEDGRTPYASSFEAAWSDHGTGGGKHYTGDELLMLVVRDLTGTLDTEAELARQQRQTEMILRAASEGVVGVDGSGRIVLVNPSAAQILGYRAGDLGGRELHPLLHHSRPDGSPLPWEETPLHDTLRSGRKHRVKTGQVLWAKDGRAVPVDLTTAPVRDGDQLVGAVLTFTDRRPYETLTEQYRQLRSVLDEALRGPLDQLRNELGGLAADPAGQLWPEANQILHHLAAGYTRMTTLVDNVLGYQRLAAGREKLRIERVSLDGVVSAGVEGAIELIGPGRAQFAVHAPPIEAEVDPERLATALAHLIADVAGVDATGNAAQPAAGGSGDSTIVVAAAQRGDVVRIEVRGPHSGGSPVHEPVVRGIVRRHDGVLQTHEVPGAGGNAYVLEVPVAAAGGVVEPSRTKERSREARDGETTVMPVPEQPVRGTDGAPLGSASATGAGDDTGAGQPDAGLGRGKPGVLDAVVGMDGSAGGPPGGGTVAGGPEDDGPGGSGDPTSPGGAIPVPPQGGPAEGEQAPRPTGRRRRPNPAETEQGGTPEQGTGRGEPHAPGGDAAGTGAPDAAGAPRATGRRARRALAAPPGDAAPADGTPASGTGTGAEGVGDARLGQPVPPQGNGPVPPQGNSPVPPQGNGPVPYGTQQQAPHGGGPSGSRPGIPQQVPPGTGRRARREPASAQGTPAQANGALPPGTGGEPQQASPGQENAQVPALAGGGRRARRLA
ncbi:PAS domain-containing protein, partial [Streptomyces sp. JJ36]|uniref:PAS domain-containing protein n=1 Tax=Streptomyces sp. JJ36 TaxID=2736645 RepID=UPI001F012E7A